MDDLARMLIECAGAKRCSECEGYPSCGGVLNLMLSAAREIERLTRALEECKDELRRVRSSD
jgi:hypothetical protein